MGLDELLVERLVLLLGEQRVIQLGAPLVEDALLDARRHDVQQRVAKAWVANKWSALSLVTAEQPS